MTQIPIHQVEHHASVVEQVADAVATARSAVHDVTMDNDAYGILCQFLPGILSPAFGLGAEALHSSVDALHETAARLRRAASGMVGADDASRRRIIQAIELPL